MRCTLRYQRRSDEAGRVFRHAGFGSDLKFHLDSQRLAGGMKSNLETRIMATYLPSREAELLTWATDFSALVSAQPEDYGLTADEAAPVTATVAAFATAYETANNRETRSPVSIETKRDAKKAMIAAVRVAVKIIQAWPR